MISYGKLRPLTLIGVAVLATVGFLVMVRTSPEVQAPAEIPPAEIEVAAPEISYTSATEDDIVVTSPAPGSTITSPLTIEGEARGPWFFEANAPVVLTDWDGLIIAEGFIAVDGEWMTTEFVSFSGTLSFDIPEFGDTGTLILQNANASGLPEHDKAIEIPINF